MQTAAPNLVVAFGADRSWHRPTIFSANEIFAGPRCETVVDQGRVRSVKTPPGQFDMVSLVRQLPPGQQPEALVVQVDRTGTTLARNLHAVGGRKILYLTDTMHMPGPIRFVLDYALTEKYDLVLGECCRQHLHYFIEAGLETRWLPLATLNPFPVVPGQPIQYPVSFVGSAGKFHPYRRWVLQTLVERKVPITCLTMPQAETPQVFARSRVNVNVTLNGGMNFRLLETLAAGAFLLYDRQSPQVGMDCILTEGEDLVTYADHEDLVERIGHYLANPGEAQRIAERGHQTYLARHTPEIRTRQFHDLVFRGAVEPQHALALEPRCRRPVVPYDALIERIRAYEYVQEEHRKALRLEVAATASVSSLLLSDLADLWRSTIAVECPDDGAYRRRQFFFASEAVDGKIALRRSLDGVFSGKAMSLLIVTGEDLRLLDRLDRLGRAPNHVVVEGGRSRLDLGALAGLTDAMARRGYLLSDPALPAFRRGLGDSFEIPTA